MSSWTPAEHVRNLPVAVIGSGVLGRRIGMMCHNTNQPCHQNVPANTVLGCIWASAGYNVIMFDLNASQRVDAITYIRENIDEYRGKIHTAAGTFSEVDNLCQAVEHAWLVIECIPERIQLKVKIFAELEALAPKNAILASNSSLNRPRC